MVSIVALASLIAGCTSKAPLSVKEAKALENPTSTNTPEKPASLEVAPHDPRASCPITVPQDPPFTPPVPYNSMNYEGEFWYGSRSLWTAVRENGTLQGLPHNPEGYTQKVFWWRDG